jgi:hypothetical protein
LEYLDESEDQGQDENDGLEAILLAEKAYFIARDHNGIARALSL